MSELVTHHSGDEPEDRDIDIRHLAGQLQNVLDQLTRGTSASNSAAPEVTKIAQSGLDISRLQEIVRFRRRRDEVLGAALFGEPVWEMLLDLLIARLLNKRVSVSSLCIASHAPESTALRHIHRMIDAGLVDKVDDPSDGRRSLIMLSREGYRKLGELFGAS